MKLETKLSWLLFMTHGVECQELVLLFTVTLVLFTALYDWIIPSVIFISVALMFLMNFLQKLPMLHSMLISAVVATKLLLFVVIVQYL